jgi:hypothetical protein
MPDDVSPELLEIVKIDWMAAPGLHQLLGESECADGRHLEGVLAVDPAGRGRAK